MKIVETKKTLPACAVQYELFEDLEDVDFNGSKSAYIMSKIGKTHEMMDKSCIQAVFHYRSGFLKKD